MYIKPLFFKYSPVGRLFCSVCRRRASLVHQLYVSQWMIYNVEDRDGAEEMMTSRRATMWSCRNMTSVDGPFQVNEINERQFF